MTDLVEQPKCFRDPFFFGPVKEVCTLCPWFIICGTFLGYTFPLSRPEFIRKILREGHRGSEPEIISAIVMQYGCSKKAAQLAVRYQRRKLENE